ncbi:MAG: hypothetical protein ACW99L_18110, partial [Promethearchaeota archaeon]
NIEKVKDIFESANLIKSHRTFELEYDSKMEFEIIKEAIGAWSSKQVSEPIIENETPFLGEMYFYNLNQNIDPILGHQEQIIIKARVDEKYKIVSLWVGAETNETVIGVITHIWELINNYYKKRFDKMIEALHCPFCGASVDNLDTQKITVVCKNCKEECRQDELKQLNF